jgi:hypothetical protein
MFKWMLTVNVLLIITSVLSIDMRVSHLPRPEFERPGIGAAESFGVTSALFNTISRGSIALLPSSINLNVSTFVYKPKGSSAYVSNGEFSADIRGDYVLALSSSSSTMSSSTSSSSSICDNSNPILGPSITSLRWAVWDFLSPETSFGVIFNDIFSYGGVASSETMFELWGGKRISSRNEEKDKVVVDVPTCASEFSKGLVLLAQADYDCAIETRVARINFFSEPILIHLSSLVLPSSSTTNGRFIVVIVDAYYGIDNIELDLTSGISPSYILSSQNQSLSSGSISVVCTTSLGPFDISINLDPSSIALTIACANGSPGSPVAITGLAHGLSYASFGFGASGAMQLILEANGDVFTLGGVSAMSLSDPYKAPFELFPLAGRGTFARIRLGSSQPRSFIGVVDVSSQPFNADITGKNVSTQAIQNAVDFCYLYSCTVYFPVGNYLVDNTINMTQLQDLAVEGVVFEAGDLSRYYNYVLRGEVLNMTETNQRKALGLPTRATIVLSPSSIGFTDVFTLKAVIWSISLGSVNGSTYVNMDDINYCNVVQSIDVVIGSGNFGAVGLRFRGAQGTSLEDVAVYTGEGAIGVHGLGGSGGTHSNLTIIGGRFGIDGRVAQPAPTLNAIRIINSTCAGLVYGGAQTLTLVGASFELEDGVPAIVAGNPLPISFPSSGNCALPSFDNDNGPATSALDGHISVIDSYFKYFNSNMSDILSSSSSSLSTTYSSISASGSLVMSNCYFENAGVDTEGTIISIAGPPSRSFGCGTLNCGLVVSLFASGGDSFPPVSRFGDEFTFTDPLYSNDDLVPIPSSTLANITSYPPGVPLPFPGGGGGGADELVSRHCYNSRLFPSFEWLRYQEGKALCAWDLGIKGDGTDEGEALQQAIDTAYTSGAALILPRGAYITSVGLVIKPGFALIGIARTQSVIASSRSGLTRGVQSDLAFAPAILFASSDPPAPVQPPNMMNVVEIPIGTVISYLSLYTWQDLDNVTNAQLSSPGVDIEGNHVKNVWRQALNSRLGVDQATFSGKSPHIPPRYVTSHRPSIILGGTNGASGWHIQVFFNGEFGAYSKNPAKNLPFQGAQYRHFLVSN